MSSSDLAVMELEAAIRAALRGSSYPTTLPLSTPPENTPGEHDKLVPGKSDGRITSPFGNRTLRGKDDFHPGIDIGMSEGTPVYAIDAGIVGTAGWQDAAKPHNGAGLYVKINHAKGKDSFYMHLSKVVVSKDSPINAGQLIGYSGATGNVTGPHLHLEIRQNGTPRAPTTQEIQAAQHGRSGSMDA